jgi:hypothetical protein
VAEIAANEGHAKTPRQRTRPETGRSADTKVLISAPSGAGGKGGFELAGRLVMGVRAVVKAAVGKRAAEPFVKEQEEQGRPEPLLG